MNKYEEGMAILEKRFGNNTDNKISLATIALESTVDGKSRPVVREVDAYYEDGAFYVVTWAKSNKMQQIAQNNEVSIALSVDSETGSTWFTANGIGENLGWALDEKNAELRTKLRSVFAMWYDMANNENDQNCCYLAIRFTSGVININHFGELFHMDFVNKTVSMGGRAHENAVTDDRKEVQ